MKGADERTAAGLGMGRALGVLTRGVAPVARVALAALSATGSRRAILLLAALLIALYPSLTALAPIGISSSEVRNGAWSYELALLSGALGCVAMSKTLEDLSQPLLRLDRGVRLAAQTLALLLAGSFAVLLALLPAIAMAPILPAQALARPLQGALLPLATIAAAGTLLLRIRLPSGMLPWVFLVVIAAGPLVLPSPAQAESLAILVAALLSAAWLLDHPPGRSP